MCSPLGDARNCIVKLEPSREAVGPPPGARRPANSSDEVVDSRTAPAVGDRDRRHAAQRIAAIGGAGGHDFRAGWRDDGRDALSVPNPPPAGRRGSREPEPDAAAASRLARPAAPQTASAIHERSPATAGGTGTDVRGDRLGRSPRSPSSGTTPPPWPPCHGRRAVRPQPVREAWSTGAEVAGGRGRRAVRPRDAFEAGTLHRPRVPPTCLLTTLPPRIRRFVPTTPAWSRA